MVSLSQCITYTINIEYIHQTKYAVSIKQIVQWSNGVDYQFLKCYGLECLLRSSLASLYGNLRNQALIYQSRGLLHRKIEKSPGYWECFVIFRLYFYGLDYI